MLRTVVFVVTEQYILQNYLIWFRSSLSDFLWKWTLIVLASQWREWLWYCVCTFSWPSLKPMRSPSNIHCLCLTYSHFKWVFLLFKWFQCLSNETKTYGFTWCLCVKVFRLTSNSLNTLTTFDSLLFLFIYQKCVSTVFVHKFNVWFCLILEILRKPDFHIYC